MTVYKYLCFVFFLFSCNYLHAQQQIALYRDYIPDATPCALQEKIPAAGRLEGITQPIITFFPPRQPDSLRAAVLIFPGGGYSRLAIEHEGFAVARAFNEYGIAAFVVTYRLPNDSCMTNRTEAPLQDAQQAISIVRSRAAAFNIAPDRIGVVGFSAGGHLASSLGTKLDEILVKDTTKTTLRPDFMILAYPVISMFDSIGHRGSRVNLLGRDSSEANRIAWSTNFQVSTATPPTFLIHATDDKAVSVQNSLLFYQALIKNNVPASMRIFQNGGHGFGLDNKTTDEKWLPEVIDWMRANKWIVHK